MVTPIRVKTAAGKPLPPTRTLARHQASASATEKIPGNPIHRRLDSSPRDLVPLPSRGHGSLPALVVLPDMARPRPFQLWEPTGRFSRDVPNTDRGGPP